MAEIIMQGSTPTHEFHINLPSDIIEKVIVTYKQDEEIVLEKRTEDLIIEDYTIIAKLSQEETLNFKEGRIVTIQIKIKTKDGDVIPSDKIYSSVYEVLNTEVL